MKSNIFDMRRELPVQQLVMSYSLFFGIQPPKDRLTFIKNIPKSVLIGEIAMLNARLISFSRFRFKYELNDQLNELFYFSGEDEQVYQVWKNRLELAFQANKSDVTDTKLVVFHRPANLLFLQEVIREGIDLSIDNHKMSPTDWDNLLKYYLCINEVAGSFSKENRQGFSRAEIIAANSVFLNELYVILNPILSIERISKWVDNIKSTAGFGRYFESFFNPVGFPFGFFLKQMFIIFSREEHPIGDEVLYRINKSDQFMVRFFDELSQRKNIKQGHKWDLQELKYGPFYKDLNNDNYILLDKIFLIEKVYEQFINDFFEKYLKAEGVDFSYYRGKFGGFFERYIADIFSSIYGPRKHNVLLSLDELKIRIKGQEHELADLYLRENKKIFIAQIKSNGLRNDQFSGDPNKFFTNKEGEYPEFFYNNFGLFQLVKSIEYLLSEIAQVDFKFPLGRPIDIFPAIIVNEKLFHTPLLPKIFNEKFKSKLPTTLPKYFNIRPVVIMHVEDVENIEDSLKTDPRYLWDLLKKHYKGSYLEKPFNITLKREKLVKDITDYKKLNFLKHIDLDEEE